MGNFIHSVCLAIALAATDVVAARADVTSIADIHKISDTNEIVEVKGTVTGTGPWHVLLNDRTDCIVAYDTFRRSFARTGDVLRVRAKIEFNHGYRRLRIQTTEIVGHDGELATPIPVTQTASRLRRGCPPS